LNWFKVYLTCKKKEVSIIEEIFTACNAISISLVCEEGGCEIYEPKVGETPLWNNIELSALFEKKISKEFVISILSGIPYSNLNIIKLNDQNWIEKYQKNFKPIKFGKKLRVAPSWSQDVSIQECIDIKIDPGLAFGTGSHETTHLCLEYLDENPPKNLSVLDYGCGSGILSIASLLLGASNAIALDIDPQAIVSTKVNAIRNKVAKKIQVGAPLDFADTKVDILFANILFNTLIKLKHEFSMFLNSGSKIILSGVMNKQKDKLIQDYKTQFEVKMIKNRNEWCLLELEKR